MKAVSQLQLTFLLNACWQIALVAAAGIIGDRMMARAGARYRHLVWVAALLLSAGLPSLALFLSSDSGSAFFSNSKQIEAPAVPIATVDATTPTRFALLEVPETAPAAAKPARLVALSSTSANLLGAICCVFLCYRFIRLLMAWRAARAIVRSAHIVEPAEEAQTIFRECMAKIGVKRARLLYSNSIAVPITVGIAAPAVILPEHLLHEADRSLLTSALGHELIHVLRRDYLLNLIYELIYLPLSFHPAAMLMRRRIRQTRELGCDELVTEKLIDPETYARSLVRLASSALPSARNSAAITVGISDADILEERVMRMLKRSRLSVRRKNLLLLAAALLLAVPCAAAVPFAMGINIKSMDGSVDRQEIAGESAQASGPTGFNVVMPVLADGEQAGTVVAWLKRPGDTVQTGEALAKVDAGKGPIAIRAAFSGVVSRLVVKPGEPTPAGALIAVIEPQQDQKEAAARRAERERRLVEMEALRRAEQQAAEEGVRAERQDAEARRREEQALKERLAAAKNELRLKVKDGTVGVAFIADSDDPEIQARRRVERELIAKEQSELAKHAKIAMHQAIQIAANLYPGAVIESRLTRERNQPCYVLSILSENGLETTMTRVLISAVDGTIINAFKEEH
ncbi:MAG: hypothetical protein DMF61_01825 [Blastocatellia bacterium AA13]|nr:MAG: hypothetical protein DMF61_01825 [Blastocatellia bacterium AA13]